MDCLQADSTTAANLEKLVSQGMPKSEDSRQPQCPVEKEKAIKDALEHFGNGIISVSRMNMKTNKREDRVWS